MRLRFDIRGSKEREDALKVGSSVGEVKSRLVWFDLKQ